MTRAAGPLLLALTLASGCRCDPPKGSPRSAPSPAMAATAQQTMAPTPNGPRSRPSTPDAAVASRARQDARPDPARATRDAAPPQVRIVPRVVAPGVRLRGARLDIDVHRADVRELLTALARATNTNIVLLGEVKGAVTVQLRDQPLHQAVEVVALAVGCRARWSGRMLVVRCK